jgi:hypothetical protein
MHNFTLPENAKVFPAIKPAADAAGRTGRYFNTALAHKLYLVFLMDQGNAATVACDLLQATSAAGAGAKVLTGVRRIWTNLDAALNDTYVRQADALSFTTDAAVKEKLVIIEVNPGDLDTAGGFLWVAARTGASNAANITAALAHIVPMYAGAAQPTYTA